MTERGDLLVKAGKLLAHDADREEHEPSREVRARTIAAMEAALRARTVKRRRSTWIARTAIAAGVLFVLFGGQRIYASMHAHATNSPEIAATARVLGGRTTALRDGHEIPFQGKLASGDRVTTQQGAQAEIALSTGTSLVLRSSSELTLTKMEKVQTFTLGTGAVNARVAKLHEGERFLVRTADAEVEVRGTVFEVSLEKPDPACGNGTPTRVRVSEGVVVVRKGGVEARVAAGEQWPTGCASVAAPEEKPAAAVVTKAPEAAATVPVKLEVPPPSVAVAVAPKPSVAAPPSASVPAPPIADGLATKNDVFAAALRAKSQGQLHTALAGFDSYLSKYPDGELVENATAQRMNILSKIDPPRGIVAAKQYLARFPNGFAREEAEAIVAAP
jgi:ferric-dicitrate binding protein FerR (iron transport regulator)